MTSTITKFHTQLTPVKIQWFRRQLIPWGKSHLRDFPWRNSDRPYHIFVAEFLLQKTAAATVAPIYNTFLARYPTLAHLAAASVEEVAPLLQPLGLHFRVKRLCDSARIVLEEYEGNIPDTEAQLLALPGIGKYSARMISSIAFSKPSAVLDTNCSSYFGAFFWFAGNSGKVPVQGTLASSRGSGTS